MAAIEFGGGRRLRHVGRSVFPAPYGLSPIRVHGAQRRAPLPRPSGSDVSCVPRSVVPTDGARTRWISKCD